MIATEEQAQAFVAERCGDVALEKVLLYVSALIAENERQNLISNASVEKIWQRHIADSAQLLDHVPRETMLWLDLGSGPGLPGLVLAAMRPESSFVLVESRKRRVEFLEKMREDLELPNVHIHGSKLEHVESFDAGVITARAFAPLPKLIDLSSRFSTTETVWVLPKGRSAEQELLDQSKRIAQLFHVEHSATDPDARILIGRGLTPRGGKKKEK